MSNSNFCALMFRFPQFSPMPLESIVPNASPDAVELLTELLFWNPNKRPTCSQALRSAYFRVNQKLGAQQISNSSAVSKSNMHRALHNGDQRPQQQLQNYGTLANGTNVHNNQQPPAAATERIGSEKSNGLRRSSFFSDSNLANHLRGPPPAADNNNDDTSGESGQSRNARVSSHSLIRSGVSAKDQYLSRSRYVAGQPAAKSTYRATGECTSRTIP